MNEEKQNGAFRDKRLSDQREYFETGITRGLEFRASMLRLLSQSVKNREQALLAALENDLGKSAFEGYATELGLVYRDVSTALRKLKKWAKPKRSAVGLVNFPSRGRSVPEPKGVVLVFVPWNYPVQLALAPLAAAIAAGNCAALALSEKCPETSECLRKLIADNFDPKFVAAFVGSPEENGEVLKQKFDHIFFTGSTRVGRIVYEAAAKSLTPVTLELGGKSPCIVDASANLRSAARRIVWGKSLNCGQTCVAPDYVLAENSVREKFVEELKRAYLLQFPEGVSSPDWGKLVDNSSFTRLQKLCEGEEILFSAGTPDPDSRKFPFTVVSGRQDSPLMREEIFGPVLPVLGFDSLAEAKREVSSRGTPLACYIFSEDRENIRELLKLRFGGGCVNDTVSHLIAEGLPFGGFGESGIGSYHGERGFAEFSHYKSVLARPGFELSARYAPYKGKEKTVRKFLK